MRNKTEISTVWPREAIYGQTRQIISKTYREAQKLNSVIDCSHIVLHLEKYKIKLIYAERNQNQESLTPGSHLWTNRQIISKTYREAQKLNSLFYCSHIVVHLKKYKIKLMYAERNQNPQRLTPVSHLWTNPSNYLENVQRGAKIDFSFWSQSHCTTSRKIENKIHICGTKPTSA